MAIFYLKKGICHRPFALLFLVVWPFGNFLSTKKSLPKWQGLPTN
jgi:hypothetical protein